MIALVRNLPADAEVSLYTVVIDSFGWAPPSNHAKRGCGFTAWHETALARMTGVHAAAELSNAKANHAVGAVPTAGAEEEMDDAAIGSDMTSQTALSPTQAIGAVW